jgi:hypothetical protein
VEFEALEKRKPVNTFLLVPGQKGSLSDFQERRAK